MTLLAITDKAGLEAGLDSGDNALVDVALALLTACNFDVEVNKALTVNNANAQLLCMSCVKQHAFHSNFSSAR
jgi:hypothetical protein